MKKKIVLLKFFLIIFFAIMPAKASDVSQPRQYWIGNDLVDFVISPYESLISKQSPAAWIIPTFAFFLIDKPVTFFYERTIQPALKPFSDVIDYSSWIKMDNVMFEALKIFFVINSTVKNSELDRFLYNAAEASIDGYFLSQSLKHIFGRARPLDKSGHTNWFNLAFDPGGPYTSFPSTHATFYFAYSTIIGKSIQNEWVGDIIGLTSFFALTTGHNHWASDIWVGYLLGKSIGNYVWEKNKKADLRDNFFVYPTFFPQEGMYYPMMGFWKTF